MRSTTRTRTRTIVAAVFAVVLFALVKLALHEWVAHGQVTRRPNWIVGAVGHHRRPHVAVSGSAVATIAGREEEACGALRATCPGCF